MVEQKATIYIAITGARLAGTLAMWAVMQDGECIALGEDYSLKADNDGLVETRKLNTYITSHPTTRFSTIGLEVTTFERLASPLPDNAGELSICISDKKAEMPDVQKREVLEVKRVLLALTAEYKYCERAIRVIRSSSIDALVDLERGITPEKKMAQIAERFKFKPIDKLKKRQQTVKQFEHWRSLLDEKRRQGTTKTSQSWTVATDGSYRSVHSKSLGSYAWVSHDGKYGRGELDFCNDASLAEVAAIFFSLLAAPQDASGIQIITDSETAIHLIQGRGSSKFHSVTAAVKLVRKAMADQNVTLQWVKGHQKHPLNVAADKLASYKNQRTEDQALELVQQAVKKHAELNIMSI